MKRNKLFLCLFVLTGCFNNTSEPQQQQKTNTVVFEYSEEALKDYFGDYTVTKKPNFDKPELNREYIISRSNGNDEIIERVVFVDNTAPRITLDNPVCGISSEGLFVVDGITITDNYDTDLTPAIYGIDSTLTGTYKVAIDVMDSSGNRTTIKTKMEYIPNLEGDEAFISDTFITKPEGYSAPIEETIQSEPESVGDTESEVVSEPKE